MMACFKMNFGSFLTMLLVTARFGIASANATPFTISDIDLANISFEITDPLGSGDFPSNPIRGVSNGIGFTFSGPRYAPGSNVTGSQIYNDIPDRGFDDLHVGLDFTITFDQPIRFLLAATANNNPPPSDGLELDGVLVDAVDIVIIAGVSALSDNLGALGLYDFGVAGVTQVSHVNTNIEDGFDFSFFVFRATEVEEPPSFLLMLLGLIGGGVLYIRGETRYARINRWMPMWGRAV